MTNMVIIGGDKRQKYLKEYLSLKGYDVVSYGLFDWDDDTDKLKGMIGEDSVIILPLPATRNDKTIVMPFSKREISIESGEEYSFIENLKDYVKIDESGIYYFDLKFLLQ